MNRHAFAWESFAFGALFLAIVGNWVALKQDTFTLDQLSVAAPITLIVLGILGIIASIWRKK
jgi:F0F1-type ATP synthase assembly protein I